MLPIVTPTITSCRTVDHISRFYDTWEWDGEAWTQVADTGPPRSGGGLVYNGKTLWTGRSCNCWHGFRQRPTTDGDFWGLGEPTVYGTHGRHRNGRWPHPQRRTRDTAPPSCRASDRQIGSCPTHHVSRR